MKDQWIMGYKNPLTVDRCLLLDRGQQTGCVLSLCVLTGIPLGASSVQCGGVLCWVIVCYK